MILAKISFFLLKFFVYINILFLCYWGITLLIILRQCNQTERLVLLSFLKYLWSFLLSNLLNFTLSWELWVGIDKRIDSKLFDGVLLIVEWRLFWDFELILYERWFFRVVSHFFIDFFHTIWKGLVSCFRSMPFILLPFELMRMHIFGNIMLVFILVVKILMLRWLLFIRIPIWWCLMPLLISDNHLHELLMSYLSFIFIRRAD